MNRLADKFTKHIHVVPETGCWIWCGTQSRNEYGRVYHDGKRRQAHRVVYELLVGAIPQGLVLDHLCRVRCCCNPAHLEAVTVRENTHRGNAVLFTPVQG